MRLVALLRRLRASRQGLAAVEFALIAPCLLALAFGVIVYSIYFTAVLGVRQAASEGARAAVAGLSTAERTTLAKARAQVVIDGYTSLLGGTTKPTVDAAADTANVGVFKVTVTYNMDGSPIMKYSSFVPLPNHLIQSSVLVTNGGY